jgi:hypothetical protein
MLFNRQRPGADLTVKEHGPLGEANLGYGFMP